MKRIAKVLFVVFILLIVSTACGNMRSDENLTVFVIDRQKPLGDDRCGGVVRRIYVVGPLPEDTPHSEIIEQKALLVYEEEIPFVFPHEIEIVEEKTVYMKDLSVDIKEKVVYLKDLGVDPKDFSVTFSEISEPSHCYVPRIGEIRWQVTSIDCYQVTAKKQEFVLIDGPRGISEWKDTEPPLYQLWEWQDDSVLETAVFPDGLVVYEQGDCLVED